jgi:hypothetical protein
VPSGALMTHAHTASQIISEHDVTHLEIKCEFPKCKLSHNLCRSTQSISFSETSNIMSE